MTQLLTNSRLRTFRACKRRHQWRYEERIRPARDALSLSLGSILHGGLEQWMLAAKELKEGLIGPAGETGQPDQYMLKLMLAGAQATFAGLGEDTEVNEYEWEKAQAMLLGYHVRWYDWVMSPEVEILAVEVEFRTPLRNPATGRASRLFDLGGKLDVIIRVGGRVLIMEHKSSSEDVSAGSHYWQRLRIDGQVSTYYEGARSLGYDVEGCLYDVLLKPQIRPLRATPEENRKWTKGKGCKECGGTQGGKGGVKQGDGCSACDGTGWAEEPRLHAGQRTEDETPAEYGERVRAAIGKNPEAYYAHGDVTRLEEEVYEYGTDTWITAKSLRDCQLQGGWARNPDACEVYRRFCDYWDVCTGGCEIDDPGRFRRSDVLHPELSESIQKPKEEAEDDDCTTDDHAGEEFAS